MFATKIIFRFGTDPFDFSNFVFQGFLVFPFYFIKTWFATISLLWFIVNIGNNFSCNDLYFSDYGGIQTNYFFVENAVTPIAWQGCIPVRRRCGLLGLFDYLVHTVLLNLFELYQVNKQVQLLSISCFLLYTCKMTFFGQQYQFRFLWSHIIYMLRASFYHHLL